MVWRGLEIRGNLDRLSPDVLTQEAVGALEALAHFGADRKSLMADRIERRASRARDSSGDMNTS